MASQYLYARPEGALYSPISEKVFIFGIIKLKTVQPPVLYLITSLDWLQITAWHLYFSGLTQRWLDLIKNMEGRSDGIFQRECPPHLRATIESANPIEKVFSPSYSALNCTFELLIWGIWMALIFSWWAVTGLWYEASSSYKHHRKKPQPPIMESRRHLPFKCQRSHHSVNESQLHCTCNPQLQWHPITSRLRHWRHILRFIRLILIPPFWINFCHFALQLAKSLLQLLSAPTFNFCTRQPERLIILKS